MSSNPSPWSWSEDKAFEEAVAAVLPAREDDGRWWKELSSKVPARSPAEVRAHYEVLLEDIRGIESGRVPIPSYSTTTVSVGEEEEEEKQQSHNQQQQHQRGVSKSEQERRKGIPWTEEEHKLFLLGLSKYGKGDWRSISRNFVISRTPTQVASHAQKYFIRLNSMHRDRRRSSIHDITSVNGGNAASSPHGPIAGHAAVVMSNKHQLPPMYIPGTPMGQPLTGHMVSAVGTPVMLPPGHAPYPVPMAYPVTSRPVIHR